MIMVEILSGNYKGLVGHLSYDDDRSEWIVVDFMGHHLDIDTKTVEYKFI